MEILIKRVQVSRLRCRNLGSKSEALLIYKNDRDTSQDEKTISTWQKAENIAVKFRDDVPTIGLVLVPKM